MKPHKYLALTALAGYVELGSLLFAIKEGVPLWAYPLIACSYQLSNFIPQPISLHPIFYVFLAVGALSISLLLQSSFSWLVIIVYTFCIATAIQGARSILKPSTGCNRALKRSVRLFGFALSFTFGSQIALNLVSVICLMTLLSYDRLLYPEVAFARLTLPAKSELNFLMLIHQVHYFCYYLLIPWLFYYRFGLSPYMLPLCFIFGWLSYISAHLIWKNSSRRIFLLGHLFAAFSIMILFLSHNLLASLTAWIMTGFGGGTVYVLRNSSPTSTVDMALDFWEAVGHVVGPLITFFIIIIVHSPYPTFIVASSIAFITGITGLTNKLLDPSIAKQKIMHI